MTNFPRKTASSKTGSNFKGAQAVSAQRARAIDARNRVYRKAQSPFRRQKNAIVSRTIASRAATILEEHRRAFDEASLKLCGDAWKIAAAKRRAQAAITRMLSKSIPKYRRYKAAERAYLRGHTGLVNADIAAAARTALGASLGDLVLVPAGVDEFTATYELFDVDTLDVDDLFKFNESFAEPNSGIVVNNVKFVHNDAGSIAPALFTYNPFRFAYTRSSLGINYTIPETGFLTCSSVIQNLYNKITFSVSDNFGFSGAYLDIYVNLYIDIIRAGDDASFARNMLTTGLVSHGSDLSFSTSEIQDLTPFTLTFTAPDAFLKGETIQVLAGSEIFIRSDLDDMKSHVDAVLMWQLKKLLLGVNA
jgi:hypothetical protein